MAIRMWVMEPDSTQDISAPPLSIRVAAGLVVGKAIWPSSPAKQGAPPGASAEERRGEDAELAVAEEDMPVDLSSSAAAQALFRARLQFALSRMAPFLRQEFENKSDMQRHSKEVHRLDEKGHKCPKCFKSFPTSQQLAQHSLVHTNIRKYQCQYCDKAFKQLSHVQQHQRIHTGERPYKCTMESCSKSFAQLANLQGHLKSHDSRAAQAEKKPFCCNVCDRRFATEASLNHHVTKLHSAQLARPMDLTCQVCEKQCADEERFFKHIHKYHPDYWRVFSNGRPLTDFVEIREPKRREKRYSCPICNKKYSHETGYVKHLATHPGSDPKLRLQLYSCPVNSCQKLFTKETYLLRHMEMKLDPPHTGALDEWKKRPPAQQVMMTRPVSIPEDLMTRAATIDGPSSSSSSSSMHERLALMRSLASTPHRGNQSPPQNLGRERPSSPHVILDDGHQPMEICESHSSTQQLPHPHHPHHPHHSTKLEIIHATATPVCSTETFKFTQPPSHHLAGKSPHRHSTPSDLGAEVPCDLTTGVTSTCLSPGPMSSGSSTPPTPAFPRAGEMNLGQNTVFQRLHDMQTVASLGTYPNRNVSSRSFSMNDLHLEANYGKSSLVQNSYTVPKIPASPNLPHHNSMTGQNLSCSSNNTFPRSPEPQLPKSPEVSLLRSDNASHYSPDGANTPGLSPSRHGLTLDNHSGFVTSHSSFIESHHEAVPSSPAAVASPAPLHGMIPPTASFLHPSVTTSFSGHSGLQSMSHHYIHRAPNPEHEVASTLQNLARSLSNFR